MAAEATQTAAATNEARLQHIGYLVMTAANVDVDTGANEGTIMPLVKSRTQGTAEELYGVLRYLQEKNMVRVTESVLHGKQITLTGAGMDVMRRTTPPPVGVYMPPLLPR